MTAPVVPFAPTAAPPVPPSSGRIAMGTADRVVVAGLIAVPLVLVMFLVWLPTVLTVVLSTTEWDGTGGLGAIRFVGLDNYIELFSAYPTFWPAVVHNLVWLGVFLLVTPVAVGLAFVIDREIRGSQLYLSAFYLPVVLSLAVIGIIWELQYAPEQGLINNALGTTGQDNLIDWLGDRDLNLWAVLAAASWRHVGYIVVIYLAALRTVDPRLREAAALDGASEFAAFRHITFPTLHPVNVVIVVITVIDALRAFDIVYVINRGLNGLELLAVLVTHNILGEASRVGLGSAIATILLGLSIGPIAMFVRRALRAGQPR